MSQVLSAICHMEQMTFVIKILLGTAKKSYRKSGAKNTEFHRIFFFFVKEFENRYYPTATSSGRKFAIIILYLMRT